MEAAWNSDLRGVRSLNERANGVMKGKFEALKRWRMDREEDAENAPLLRSAWLVACLLHNIDTSTDHPLNKYPMNDNLDIWPPYNWRKLFVGVRA